MSDRFTVRDAWSLYKGLTVVRFRAVLSGTTPVLQEWLYPGPNSGSTGSYTTAQSSGAGAGGFGFSAGAEGVKSITRTGAGLWTVVLQTNFNRLLDLHGYQSLAGGAATIVGFAENTTISDMTTAGGSTVGLALLSSTGTAADPATTTIITVNMLLQNSSAP